MFFGKIESADELPGLAWLARYEHGANQVDVRHGSGVEVLEDAIVEGAWSAPFAEGGFHLARHFFGSGLRLTEDAAIAAASTGLVDRVVYARSATGTFISNSLPLLLAATETWLEPEHDYTSECHALVAGKRKYPRGLHVSSSPFQAGQVYGENLRLTASSCDHIARTSEATPFRIFEDYRAALDEALGNLLENLNDPRRRVPVRTCTTVSSGYDSAATAALVRRHGVLDCFTTSPRTSIDLEDGETVAHALDLRCTLLEPNAMDPETELAMLAGTLDGREHIFGTMATALRQPSGVSAVFTGYHGDKVWCRHTRGHYLSEDVMRGDTSGLNLTEARLMAGFINIPVPFLFAERIRDLVSIANSPEMAPWRVDTGYDRPIPRRILEQAGVPRSMFGQRKCVVMDYQLLPRNSQLRRDLLHYLQERFGYGRATHSLHELLRSLDDRMKGRSARVLLGRTPPSLVRRLWPAERQLANRIFVWSVNTLAQRFRSACTAF